MPELVSPVMSIDASMAALADALAKKHSKLDVSLASLGALEALMTGKPVTEATTRAWSAYVGECMRRARPDDVAWETYDEAAATQPTIAKMERGYDIEAILRVGDMHWFPLAKVEKFQRNGAEDSVVAFAGVALDFLPDPEQAKRDRARHAKESATCLALGKRVAKKVTAAALLELDSEVFTKIGGATEPRNAETVRSMGFSAASLAALLDEKAVGRGTARKNPGHAAAYWLAALAIHGIEPIPALPPKASAVAKENHAYARCYVDLRAGETAVTVAAGASKDKAQRAGALEALSWLANDWHMGRAYTEVPFSAFAPLVVACLDPKLPHLAAALDVVWTWRRRKKHTADITPVIPALLRLSQTKAKPTVRQQVERILDSYALGIVHGHVPDDKRVAGLVREVRARVASRAN